MFKLENFIRLNDNQFAKIKLHFDYYPNKDYYMITIWQMDKNYTIELNFNDSKLVITPNDYGDLFLEVMAIILKDLNIGKINIENNKIIDLTITKNEFEKITSKYEVHLYKQDFYQTRKVYKISEIS